MSGDSKDPANCLVAKLTWAKGEGIWAPEQRRKAL